MNAAERLKAALAASQGPTPRPITDEFALAIARKLEARGIAKVPGVPDDEERWQDTVLTFLQEQRDIEERSAERRRQAEAEAQHTAPPSTAAILAAEIAKAGTSSGSAHMPLNGAQVLRTALAGGGGTINGGQLNTE